MSLLAECADSLHIRHNHFHRPSTGALVCPCVTASRRSPLIYLLCVYNRAAQGTSRTAPPPALQADSSGSRTAKRRRQKKKPGVFCSLPVHRSRRVYTWRARGRATTTPP
ncbi:hypothetical protein MTO96_011358 [Rhipicephalus appendiculatus]